MSRPFYVYPRNNGIFYAELIDQHGSRVWRSTRSRDKTEAAAIIGGWLKEGVPVAMGKAKKPLKEALQYKQVLKYLNDGDIEEAQALEMVNALKNRGLVSIGISQGKKGQQGLIDFLYDFWDYEKSVYLEDRRAHGKTITKRTCQQSKNGINAYWKPYFENKTILQITKQELRAFGLELSKRLAGKTVNNILHIGNRALRWAHSEKMIPENITEGIGGFVGGGKKRDILTEGEIKNLFQKENWNDQMAYSASMLAYTTGLRNGEIRALRKINIGDKAFNIDGEIVYLLQIKNSWNDVDGLKLPKNNEEGTVYLLPEIRDKLFALLAENPYTDIETNERFIFWGLNKDRPCGGQRLLKGLHYAIDKAGIELKDRKIDLHSFRHANGTKLYKETGDIRKVAKSLRHKSLKMTEHYTDHSDDDEVAAMGASVAGKFSNILNFPAVKGA